MAISRLFPCTISPSPETDILDCMICVLPRDGKYCFVAVSVISLLGSLFFFLWAISQKIMFWVPQTNFGGFRATQPVIFPCISNQSEINSDLC